MTMVGRVHAVVGGMCSGKSAELVRLVVRARIAKQQVQLFKPKRDDRSIDILSRNGTKIEAMLVRTAWEIQPLLVVGTKVVALDEAQFFNKKNELLKVITELAILGYEVLVAGLDTNFLGEPYYPIPDIIAVADEVTHLYAICMVCGKKACRTQRLKWNGTPASRSDPLVVIGGDKKEDDEKEDYYEARCRWCHKVTE